MPIQFLLADVLLLLTNRYMFYGLLGLSLIHHHQPERVKKLAWAIVAFEVWVVLVTGHLLPNL